MWWRRSPPACVEDLGVLDGDLLQRLQAIGDEARIEDGDALDALMRKALDRLVGVGLQPFLRAEAGLEGDEERFARPSPGARAGAGAVFWQWQ